MRIPGHAVQTGSQGRAAVTGLGARQGGLFGLDSEHNLAPERWRPRSGRSTRGAPMTPEVGRISEFLLDLYRDARHRNPGILQRETLARLREFIPFDFGVWGGGLDASRQITDIVVLDRSPVLVAEWGHVAAIDGYCDLALRRLGYTVLFDDLPGFRDSIAYTEHWLRFDACHMVATIMAEPIQGYVSFIGLGCTDPERRYSEGERLLKQLLMPHVSGALRLCHESRVLDADCAGEGAALVNSAGMILASRAPFLSLVHEEWHHHEPRVPIGILPAWPASVAWRGRAIQVRIEPLGPYFLLRARPCHPLEHLAPREQQVAERFARGSTHKQIARELGLAPSTVRNQLAAIYNKLSVNDKGALASLIHGAGGSAPGNVPGAEPL